MQTYDKSQTSKDIIKKLFDENGNFIKPVDEYFDEDGDLINYFEILQEYANYPANSDIVKIYYTEECSSVTHGNYSTYCLFSRM